MNVYRHAGVKRVAIVDFDVHHGNGTGEFANARAASGPPAAASAACWAAQLGAVLLLLAPRDARACVACSQLQRLACPARKASANMCAAPSLLPSCRGLRDEHHPLLLHLQVPHAVQVSLFRKGINELATKCHAGSGCRRGRRTGVVMPPASLLLCLLCPLLARTPTAACCALTCVLVCSPHDAACVQRGHPVFCGVEALAGLHRQGVHLLRKVRPSASQQPCKLAPSFLLPN